MLRQQRELPFTGNSFHQQTTLYTNGPKGNYFASLGKEVMLSTADHVAEDIDLTGEGGEGARLVASGRRETSETDNAEC